MMTAIWKLRDLTEHDNSQTVFGAKLPVTFLLISFVKSAAVTHDRPTRLCSRWRWAYISVCKRRS